MESEHRKPALKFTLNEDAKRELDLFVRDIYLDATVISESPPWPYTYAQVWAAIVDYAASEMGRETLRTEAIRQRCIWCGGVRDKPLDFMVCPNCYGEK